MDWYSLVVGVEVVPPGESQFTELPEMNEEASIRLQGRFMCPQSIETRQYLYKVCTWAYSPEIHWESWFIYSNKCWLNCIFFFSRTINSFPFSDWIRKSKNIFHEQTMIVKLLFFVCWSLKLYLPMHFFPSLYQIRTALFHFIVARTICGSWLVSVSRSPQKSIDDVKNPTAKLFLASILAVFHQLRIIVHNYLTAF